jgi:hypothetical protein
MPPEEDVLGSREGTDDPPDDIHLDEEVAKSDVAEGNVGVRGTRRVPIDGLSGGSTQSSSPSASASIVLRICVID